ncbi:helicase HerA-like domain-containing protein [Diaminobutyricimonas sp. LJ205]|uniref:helicase HerA-like domain-containing protein n=1 Tax=Diaminobutyricimonas sp. LJ205 TaxID=2683590 RepID=UPI0012F4786F|nr:helicase HerA-like domain-containing protein [Diaminobutyricimonas sp. LJ205]
MTDAAAAVEAAKKALEEAQQALKAAEEAARRSAAPPVEPAEAVSTGSTNGMGSANGMGSTSGGPLSAEQVETIRAGYAFEAPALEMGALVNGEALADVPVRIPIAMTNRHGLVAGATGTGKTKTLQVLAEQLSANGVPVFAADIKGDLSGIASAGEPNDKLLARTRGIGQDWSPQAAPTEYYSLGGKGSGIPIRATVSSFGPLLLSKVLGLNETQESSLGLVFHYADQAGLPLLDLADLRAVLVYLTGDEGKAELKQLGGLSSATVGVILRELITFADQGADAFFGEPEFDTAHFLRTAADGRGIVSLLEVPSVRDQPALFSTFLMWLLADLFNDLPEVGDTDKPKLVFFFDEAHLLFSGASTDFITQIVQTVRLIRSKGVGIFFVTQTPKDVPNDVLAQLGSRVQHQLRAHTPDDAQALRATVSTYPTSGYELEEVLTSLATGEAIVTVMNERGAPSPVAWTRMRAPQGSMEPTDAAAIAATVKQSPLLAQYGTAFDRESAREILAARMNAAAAADDAERAQEDVAKQAADQAKTQAKAQADYEKAQREWEQAERRRTSRTSTTRRTTSRPSNPAADVLGSQLGKTVVREVLRGIFGTLKRR